MAPGPTDGSLQGSAAEPAHVHCCIAALLVEWRLNARLAPAPSTLPQPPSPPAAHRLPADLQGMGGLAPVVALLAPQQPTSLQAAAAHLLGTAASNNAEFQRQLLTDHPEALPLLLQLLRTGSGSASAASVATATNGSDGEAAQAAELAAAAATAEAATKALYCLAAMLRLNADCRDAFYQAAGVQALQLLLGSRQTEPRLKRKALSLLADLIQLDGAAMGAAAAAAAQQQGQGAANGPVGALDYPSAVATALQLLDVGEQEEQQPAAELDRDLQEKALLVLQALLAPPDGHNTPSSAASRGSASDSGSSSGSSSWQAAAELVAESGGRAILRRLQASLQAEADVETGAAAAEEGSEDEGDASYLADLLQLARRVEEQAAAGSNAGAGGGSNGCVTGSNRDSSEL